MRRRFRLVLAGACALLAVLLCVLYGQHVREEAESERAEVLERYGGEVVQLVVAAEGLEAGDTVDAQNVTLEDWVSDLAPDDAVTDLEDVLGLEVTVPVSAGVPLTSLNFRDSDDAIDVPSGYVALSIPVSDKLGLPSSAAAGMSVVVYEVVDSGALLLTSDVQVLRVPGETTLSSSSGSITLAVRPDDVSEILSASAEGSLRLAIPADDVEGLEPDEAAPTEVEPQGTTIVTDDQEGDDA